MLLSTRIISRPSIKRSKSFMRSIETVSPKTKLSSISPKFGSDRVLRTAVKYSWSNLLSKAMSSGTPTLRWTDDHSEWGKLMQAISHFSYHSTGRKYVLCDLQGGFNNNVQKHKPYVIYLMRLFDPSCFEYARIKYSAPSVLNPIPEGSRFPGRRVLD